VFSCCLRRATHRVTDALRALAAVEFSLCFFDSFLMFLMLVVLRKCLIDEKSYVHHPENRCYRKLIRVYRVLSRTSVCIALLDSLLNRAQRIMPQNHES
jgi:hypothetical protein